MPGLKPEPDPPLAAGARAGAEPVVPWGWRPGWLWAVSMPLLKEALPLLLPLVLLLSETGPDGLARPGGVGGVRPLSAACRTTTHTQMCVFN